MDTDHVCFASWIGLDAVGRGADMVMGARERVSGGRSD